MRLVWVVLLLGVAACAPDYLLDASFEHANARVPYQTDPAAVLVYTTDIEQPYDVLGDLEVVAQQRSTLGGVPTRDTAVQALREQAGRIGAHAIILLSFGETGMSFWSYVEIRGHGRAIRFR